MKAIVRTQYGPLTNLQLADIPIPVPAHNEVLVRVYAASVNPLDLYLAKGGPWHRLPGLRVPKHEVIGCDIAGCVEAVGADITHFHVDDEVFGVTGFGGNGFAEYACAIESKLAPKPANLTFEGAAAVPIAAITALQGLRNMGHIESGQKVLIEGASGGVGTFAVQIAKAFQAEVTAVCSTGNVATAHLLGADHVIDYTGQDFAQSEQKYDLILSMNAHHSPFRYRRSLSRNGIFVVAGGGLVRMLQMLLLGPLLSTLGRRKMGCFLAKINQLDLIFLKHLLETGKVVPVIDRRYPLSETKEALTYLAQGHAKGKIVLNIQPGT